jgi:hypothetical protein
MFLNLGRTLPFRARDYIFVAEVLRQFDAKIPEIGIGVHVLIQTAATVAAFGNVTVEFQQLGGSETTGPESGDLLVCEMGSHEFDVQLL